MLRVGSCQCGEVRYEIDDAVHELYVCHCTNCRRQSSSAFGISFVVPAENHRVTAGAPEYFEWQSDSGAVLKGAFCAACGTPLAGVFEARPGHWGARRQPVQMRRR